MLYTCDKCLYTYPIDFLSPALCPDCGSHAVRAATEDDVKWYEDIQREKENNPLLKNRISQKAS